MSDSIPGGCEFDPRLRQLFFQAYFCLSPLQKHVRKVVGSFGKKSCVSTRVREPASMWLTDRHDMTLAVKVALNPNTTNQQKQMNKYMAEIQGPGPDSNLNRPDKRPIPLFTELKSIASDEAIGYLI